MKENETKQTYSKPIVLAANNPQGSFAAGCPEKGRSSTDKNTCLNCERTQ